MLRYGFLPSDFHPQFLILGERADIVALAATLRGFADAPERKIIEHHATDDETRNAQLELLPSAVSNGLRRADAPAAFRWELDGVGADTFAGMIEEMLAGPDPAGSTILDVAGTPNIPVKVSFGEFTEDFLISAF